MSKLTKVGVRVPEALHLKVKSEAPKRGINLEEAYAEALESWLERRTEGEEIHTDAKGLPLPAPVGVVTEATVEYTRASSRQLTLTQQVWVEMFTRLLCSGDQPVIEAVCRNVHVFYLRRVEGLASAANTIPEAPEDFAAEFEAFMRDEDNGGDGGEQADEPPRRRGSR